MSAVFLYWESPSNQLTIHRIRKATLFEIISSGKLEFITKGEGFVHSPFPRSDWIGSIWNLFVSRKKVSLRSVVNLTPLEICLTKLHIQFETATSSSSSSSISWNLKRLTWNLFSCLCFFSDFLPFSVKITFRSIDKQKIGIYCKFYSFK